MLDRIKLGITSPWKWQAVARRGSRLGGSNYDTPPSVQCSMFTLSNFLVFMRPRWYFALTN